MIYQIVLMNHLLHDRFIVQQSIMQEEGIGKSVLTLKFNKKLDAIITNLDEKIYYL